MKTSKAQLRATKKWRDTHREEYTAYMRNWQSNNKDKARENRLRYYAKKAAEKVLRYEGL
ncbi:MAG: hypothetical protein IAX22_02585 [Candidatus Bathyarchaeota archaeon]|nr:hypothetical protein [Candidatus Bathyarchaeota archaeon]